jgi:hypothetical protein
MDRHSSEPPAGSPDTANGPERPARDSLMLSATLMIGDKEWAVRVRNLSAGGLMAEFDRPVVRDQAVRIDVRGVGWVDGRVAWATAGRVGIAFDQEIDPKLARKPVSDPAKREHSWLHVYPNATPPRTRKP